MLRQFAIVAHRHARAAGLACVLSLPGVLAADAVVAAQAERSSEETLIQLERDWDAAFLRSDVRFIENVLAEEFTATYADGGSGDRARELELARAFNQQVDSSMLDDFRVKLYGDTAVVAFSRHLVGPSQGRRLEVSYRYIDVFVRRDGRWQCVASQSTKIAKP